MRLKDGSLVCTCNGCLESLVDRAKAVIEVQSMAHASRRSPKKAYQSPVLMVYGTLADLIRLKVNSGNN